jgi:hypothetical protein
MEAAKAQKLGRRAIEKNDKSILVVFEERVLRGIYAA